MQEAADADEKAAEEQSEADETVSSFDGVLLCYPLLSSAVRCMLEVAVVVVVCDVGGEKGGGQCALDAGVLNRAACIAACEI